MSRENHINAFSSYGFLILVHYMYYVLCTVYCLLFTSYCGGLEKRTFIVNWWLASTKTDSSSTLPTCASGQQCSGFQTSNMLQKEDKKISLIWAFF